MNTTKHATLKEAQAHRAHEVFHHQINIDNYRLAIEDIELNHKGVEHMEEFAEQLRGLLASSLREQDKEKIMLKVITAQLESQ
jgi:hypothetical protein